MKKVEKFYSRFGEDVVGVVNARADKDGDIKPLLRHLGLPISGVIDRQHRTLVEFIHVRGRPLFIKAVSLSGGAVAVKKLIQAVELEALQEKRLRQQQNILTPVPVDGMSNQVRRAIGPAGTDTVSPDAVLHEVYTTTYAGPNRRKTGDRRKNASDRRVECQIITFRNRRFGGRRRKLKRRAEDN